MILTSRTLSKPLKNPPNSLGLGFDDLFRDVRGVTQPKKSADEKTDGGISSE
jgi:hypothetical protein